MKRVAIIRKSSYLIKYLRVREKQEIYERKRKKKYLRVREMDRRNIWKRERNKLYEKKRDKNWNRLPDKEPVYSKYGQTEIHKPTNKWCVCLEGGLLTHIHMYINIETYKCLLTCLYFSFIYSLCDLYWFHWQHAPKDNC